MKQHIIFAAIVLFSLASCASPVPAEKNSYVGNWQSKEMTLLILQDGTVAYERVDDGERTSITGPIKEFKGDDVVIGFSILTKTLDVTEPPYRVNGKWQMVVDGVKLTKIEG